MHLKGMPRSEPRAITFVDGDFEYAVFMRDDRVGTVDAVQYLGESEDVTLPARAMDGDGKEYSVVSVGRLPYIFSESLVSLTLPDSIEKVYRINCPSMERIHVPDTVREIGPAAFTECRSLKRISLPACLGAIRPYTFDSCVSLEDVLIPEGVVTIGKFAFKGCSSLMDVNVPDGVMVIDRHAFEDCVSLERIHLPGTVTELREWAFSDCISLRDLCLKGVIDSIRIEGYAFEGSNPDVRFVSEVDSRSVSYDRDMVLSGFEGTLEMDWS